MKESELREFRKNLVGYLNTCGMRGSAKAVGKLLAEFDRLRPVEDAAYDIAGIPFGDLTQDHLNALRKVLKANPRPRSEPNA